jgi:hypothetical protein
MRFILTTFIGGYCNPSSTFTICAPGTYGAIAGGTSQEQACVACEPGYYCAGSMTNNRTICPVASYCPGESSIFNSCPPGTYSKSIGQSSLSACKNCPAGFVCDADGTVDPEECPAGYYCPAATSKYRNYPCPSGTFSLSPGLYSASQCSNCTAGHYCTGSESPASCPPGTYNPYLGGNISADVC